MWEVDSGVNIEVNSGQFWSILVNLRKPQGNLRETSGNLRETSEKPHGKQGPAGGLRARGVVFGISGSGTRNTSVFHTPRFSYAHLKTVICTCPSGPAHHGDPRCNTAGRALGGPLVQYGWVVRVGIPG